MASVCISIENDIALTQFHQVLNGAGSIAGDMIQVKTKIERGEVFKVVMSDCPGAISVFRAFGKRRG